MEPKWYFARGFHYMRIVTSNKVEHVFCDTDEHLVQFWVNEIVDAMRFYCWLETLLDLRYRLTEKSE